MRSSNVSGWSGGFVPGRSIRLGLFILLLTPSASFAADLFVNNVDPTCQGATPCYSSIQKAIDAALPGDRVQIEAGTYRESLRVRHRTFGPASSESDRIIIMRFEDSPPNSVVLVGGSAGRNCGLAAIEVLAASYVTIRGIVITGAPGAAIRVRGGAGTNAGIRIEANRIFGNGAGGCSGGIVLQNAGAETVVVNNLIYFNRGNGIELPKASARPGAAPYVIQNTIHRNEGNGVYVGTGRSVVLANNAITGNGVLRGAPIPDSGYGVSVAIPKRGDVSLWNNLLCGNTPGETRGAVFTGNHGGNLTPTGSEAAGVLASPECGLLPRGVYENEPGEDEFPDTIDDDFGLTLPGNRGLPSPAIDRGIDPRTLGLQEVVDTVLLSDFGHSGLRPIQRDINRPLDFDIGAVELACGCATNCESCKITLHDDDTSSDTCALGYDSATQCCNRNTGEISEKELGSAYDVCPDTRVPRDGFDPLGSSDGCSAVPDNPFVLCPAVRFGCDYDGGVADCPAGINLPCNNHDFCYQTCGKTKSECDLAFNDDMLDVCDNMTAGQKILCYDDCILATATYFSAVALSSFGEEAYENGQNRGCQCCENEER